MEGPSLETCRNPRLLQKYLVILARAVTKQKEDPTTTFKVADSVLVLIDGEKHPGVVTKVFGTDEYDQETVLFEVAFDDGTYCVVGAEDFC